MTNLRTAITSSFSAFDGMKTTMRIAQAGIGREEAVLQKKNAEQRVRFAVVRDYFGLIVADARRQVAAEAVRMAESDVKRARDRFDAGLGVQSDLLAAEVQLAEFKQQQIQAEGNQATATVILNVSMGSPSQTPHKLTSELLKKTFPVPAQRELARRAMLNRADYAQSESAIQSAQRRPSERRGDYLPELNLFGSFGSSARNLITGSTDYAFGAGLTFNLFDPGRASRLSQAQIEESLAENDRSRLTSRQDLCWVQKGTRGIARRPLRHAVI